MSRSTGGFGATVCHLGGAAALAVAAGSSATTAPAGRHATRPVAPCPQDRGGMWRPAPTSPWRTQHVPPQRYRRRLTAPRQRRTLSKLASSMAHLTICQPPWRCTGTTKGMWVSDRCARVRRHGNGQPTCEIAGQAGTRARRLRTPVHLIPNRMIQACPNPNDDRPAFPLVRGRFVGLAGLEPAASSLSEIEGRALCYPAFPQVVRLRMPQGWGEPLPGLDSDRAALDGLGQRMRSRSK